MSYRVSAAIDVTNTVLWAVLGSIAAILAVAFIGFLAYKRRARIAEYLRIEGMRGSVQDDMAVPKPGRSTGYSLLSE